MSAVLEKILPQNMTADEFFNSPFARGFELVEGRVVPKGGILVDEEMPTGALHRVVTDELQSRISQYVRENKLGRVFAAETEFILSAGNVRGVDISFVGNTKINEHGIPEKFFPVAPDLAVEIISPKNTFGEMQEKVEEYLAAGTKLVWLVYPKQKMVQVHRQANLINILRESDTLNGEDVLPDFNVKLSEIFEV